MNTINTSVRKQIWRSLLQLRCSFTNFQEPIHTLSIPKSVSEPTRLQPPFQNSSKMQIKTTTQPTGLQKHKNDSHVASRIPQFWWSSTNVWMHNWVIISTHHQHAQQSTTPLKNRLSLCKMMFITKSENDPDASRSVLKASTRLISLQIL